MEDYNETVQIAEIPRDLTMADVDALIMPSERTEDDDQPRFRITDDDVADWAVKKIAAAQEEYDRLTGLADREIERIKEAKSKAQSRYDADTGYLRGLLEEFFGTIGDDHKKQTKTTAKYKLISGTLTLKKGGTTYRRDDVALLGWLRETGREDLIRVKEEPCWGDLKKQIETAGGIAVIKDTGEIIEGVELETAPDEFKVEF